MSEEVVMASFKYTIPTFLKEQNNDEEPQDNLSLNLELKSEPSEYGAEVITTEL
jgi:hypothetical protein